MMRLYELTYLISPEVSEKDLVSLQENIASFIQEKEGLLTEVSPPAEKKLAYPIKKKERAFLASMIFQLKPERLKELEEKLKGEEKILRYLILLQKMPKKAPSPPSLSKKKIVEKKPKVELKEIEKKLEEILGNKTENS